MISGLMGYNLIMTGIAFAIGVWVLWDTECACTFCEEKRRRLEE